MLRKAISLLAIAALSAPAVFGQAKKKAAPAKPAAAAPAAPAAPAAAAPAPKAEEPAPVEGFFVKKVKAPGDGKEITMRLGGYVDAYYAYHTRGDRDTRAASTIPNGYAGADLGTGTAQTGRVFESPGQQFSLGLIQTKFEMGNEDWQVVADLIHGPNAEQTNFNNLRGNGGTGPTTSTSSTAIKQAYVSGTLVKNLKVTAGQWSTHVGYEVVESYQNANYTLGYLFGYGPFYHTGAKLDYALLDGKIGLMAGITNGWDLQADNNKAKSAIGQISLKPTSALSVFLNYVGGNESSQYDATTSNVGGMRHIGDLVIQYQVNKMLKLGVNVVYGENKVNTETAARKWGGAAGYVSLTPVDGFTLSYRLDYFDDRQGARGLLGTTAANGMTVMGHTLTGTISMYGGHFLIRPEVKYDQAQYEIFGVAGDLKKDNITALLAFTGVY
ncbi:MAG: outer membrane beta-barrel protein [Turneriella sp.]